MPRHPSKKITHRRRHRKAKRTRHSRSRRRNRCRRQHGGTLAFLEPQNTTIAVGLRENPEGEYDNPDNMPVVRTTPL